MNELSEIIKKLASKSVIDRKKAIMELKQHLHKSDAHLARLCLQYVSEHDPSFTVRNIARQAFYIVGEPPSAGSWEKHHLFHSE